MDANEFRKRGVELIDYIVDYLGSESERRISPKVTPGFLFPLLPSAAPEKGESFENIMDDLEKHIMPGLLHWQHRNFHAYFPAETSYPSILGEMVSNTINCSTYNWSISHSGKELEIIVLDWLGKMLGLPDDFLYHNSHGGGGGFIENSSSQCVFLSIIAAREDILKKLQDKNPSMTKITLLQSLVAYCSTESHSSVEKAANLALVLMKVLDTDEHYRLRGETLAKAIEEDIKHGLIPFFVSITVGTTSCCSCDPIDEIGLICRKNGIWLNVDAAYGGTAAICPEFRHIFQGIEHASTIIVNPIKWMLVNVEGAVLWTIYRSKIASLNIFESNLLHHGIEKTTYEPNKRFRALKLWFVIRNYGIEGLQMHVRNHVQLAEMFEKYVKNDERFELIYSQFGLVCFRLKGSNLLNRKFLSAINDSGKLYITACALNRKYVIRFCVNSKLSNESDITYAWSVFTDFAKNLLEIGNNYIYKEIPNSFP